MRKLTAAHRASGDGLRALRGFCYTLLEFHNKSLREMVEAIVKQDQEYRVSFSNGVVDIFSPRAREDRSNLLNKVLKDFSVTEMETREADFQLFCAVVQAAG